jgi:N-glycosylase/DNA lyase
MNKLYAPQYNLHKTLLGGQAFRWEQINEIYYGVVKDNIITLKQEGDYILWQTYPQKDNLELLTKYLRLDVDYLKIIQEIQKDEHINKAVAHHPGLRLLKQDPEETIISFIISANSNIPKIKRSIKLLSTMLGEKITIDNNEFYTFPSLERIADSTIDELRTTGIGYRAPYTHKSAQQLLEDNSIQTLHNLDYLNAKQELMKLPGIGNKVADCILVFGFSFDNVTPLDLWAQRALVQLYNHDPKSNYKDMMNWITTYFGEHTSWAGQFLFEYIRVKNKS